MDLSTNVGLMRAAVRSSFAAPPPPTALGLLPDIVLERGVEMTPTALFLDFSGAALQFDLGALSDPLPAGLSLSQSGILSGTPSQNTPPLNLVIRALNPHGEAQSAFSVEVQDVILNFEASISGLSANASYGQSAQAGVELTAEASGFSGATPGSVSFQWKTLETGNIAGATDEKYTPNAGLYDGETLYCEITPTGYPSKETGAAVIRHAAPLLTGTFTELPPLDVGDGDEVIDMSGFASGTALSWSVSGQGCSIDQATGVLSIRTDSPANGALARVVAQNSGGAVEIVFTFHVEDPELGPGPNLSEPILEDAANSIGLILDESATVYWRRDPIGTNPDPTDVILGGGYDGGSFAAASGSNVVNVAFATGNDGAQTISFVALNAEGEPSLVRTSLIEIDTADPSLSASLPAAGASGVSQNTLPQVTFDMAVFAASGSIMLYDVTAESAVEVFDMTTDLGVGAGQVEIVGAQVTLRPSSILADGPDYAILISPGALRDDAGNPFAGISSPAELSFSTVSGALVDTEFGVGFTGEYADLWASVQANTFNMTPDHRALEDWSAYPASLSDGGLVGIKTGNFPQLRFSVPVEIGKSYEIDADFPIGENSFSAPLRVKLGSAINLNDYGQIDETEVGQPRVAELRNFQVTATSSQLWFAIIVETGSSGTTGGNPALSMLRVREV